MDIREFALTIPKAELHVHLDGTMEPELKLEIAARNGIELAEKTADEIRAGFRFHDLETFLAVHYPNMAVLWTEQDYFDLCFRFLTRAATQGLRHVEMFFDPQLHTSRGVPFPVMIAGYRRAVLTAQRELGLSADLILCFLRDRGADYAMATLMESLPYKEWIIGVGLDSDEHGHPPVEFAEVFSRARAEGYLITVHCDIDQENSIEHIRQALEVIGVDRIDHGTNILEDPALVDLVLERGIGLTTCPMSNSFVTPQLKADEIMLLLNKGVAVTLNSDDPPYFGGYVGDNYVALQEHLGLAAADIVALAKNSFRASWLPERRRAGYLAEIDRFVEEHGPQLPLPVE